MKPSKHLYRLRLRDPLSRKGSCAKAIERWKEKRKIQISAILEWCESKDIVVRRHNPASPIVVVLASPNLESYLHAAPYVISVSKL